MFVVLHTSCVGLVLFQIISLKYQPSIWQISFVVSARKKELNIFHMIHIAKERVQDKFNDVILESILFHHRD